MGSDGGNIGTGTPGESSPVVPGTEPGVGPSVDPLGDLKNAVNAAKIADTSGTPLTPQENDFKAQFGEPVGTVPSPEPESPNPVSADTGLGDAGMSVAEAPVPTAEAVPSAEAPTAPVVDPFIPQVPPVDLTAETAPQPEETPKEKELNELKQKGLDAINALFDEANKKEEASKEPVPV